MKLFSDASDSQRHVVRILSSSRNVLNNDSKAYGSPKVYFEGSNSHQFIIKVFMSSLQELYLSDLGYFLNIKMFQKGHEKLSVNCHINIK